MSYLLKIVLLLAILTSGVQAKTIHFVLSNDGVVAHSAVNDIQSGINKAGSTVNYKTVLVTAFSPHALAEDDLLVTIGNTAARDIAERQLPNQTIISFTDSQTNHYISEKYKHDHISVISLNQTPKRVIEYSGHAIGTEYKKNVLVAISQQNKRLLAELKALAPLKNGQLQIVEIPKDALAAKVLEAYLFDAAVLVAIPDNTIWTGKNAKWLLQQAFNYKVPVIGYSKSFLNAGALASVYSSLDDVAGETAKQVNAWLNNTPSDSFTVIYPKATIEINPSIARVYKSAAQRLKRHEGFE